jgi:hypothetical protein
LNDFLDFIIEAFACLGGREELRALDARSIWRLLVKVQACAIGLSQLAE